MDSKKRRHPIMQQPVAQLSQHIDFESLVGTLIEVHKGFQFQAAKAVNISLTFRNWLFGHHIMEYEQKGRDRAVYGDRLFEKLADKLQARHIPRTDERELRRYRQFYMLYPSIREALTPKLADQLLVPVRSPRIREAVPPVLSSLI